MKTATEQLTQTVDRAIESTEARFQRIEKAIADLEAAIRSKAPADSSSAVPAAQE